VDIVSTSPALALHLSRNAGVLDAVIGGDFFTDWPGQPGLEELLQAQLARARDYEARLDGTRRWMKEWHFRIGVHLLRGLTTPREAMQQYSDLARAVLAQLLPVVVEMVARKYGPPPGRGAVVLGMGSLGAATLNATSDLDLIVIYDAEGVDSSDGPKSLNTRTYYARFTQSLITALTAPTAEGKLYEVDMRLRPSGNQGPVATSLAAFKSYQTGQAWLWEHLALTRARPIAGPASLGEDVEAFRLDLLSQPRDPSEVAREIAKMRGRIAAAKQPSSLWDVKIGPGRLQDIELLAQAGALLAGTAHPDTTEGLRAAHRAGLLDAAAVEPLAQAAEFFMSVNQAVRLLTAQALSDNRFSPASREFLARTLEMEDTSAIEARLAALYESCAAQIDKALQRFSAGDAA
jgi:glutamate-ammonia-ligase adenylyltransferase